MPSIVYGAFASVMAASLVMGDFTVPANRTGTLNCSLRTDESFREELSTLVTGHIKLIELNLQLHDQEVLKTRLKGSYKPYHWVRATGREGQSLLMLEENYDLMSLSFLSIGVASMSINITQHPMDCVQSLSPDDVMLLIRNAFFTDFKDTDSDPTSSTFGQEESICNMHVMGDDGGHASFRYQCCHKEKNGDIRCKDMEDNSWIKALLALILILKILVLLYSPMLLPESLYRLRFVACQYVYHLPEAPLPLNIVVTQDPQLYGEHNMHKSVRLSQLPNMEYFKILMSSNSWQMDTIYEVQVKDVRLSVKVRRLLDRFHVPVGLFTMLYNNLIRCRIRRLQALTACCKSSILGRFTPTGMKMMKWNKCMRLYAAFCLLVLIAIPWFVRITVYNVYEYDMLKEREEAAANVDLSLSFTGSLILYLTPVHVVFVFIYFIVIFDSFVYGVICGSLKEKVNLVMRQCLRDMREISRAAVCSWITKLTVAPFTLFGLLGFIFFPVYLIFLAAVALPVLAFYIFPTLNLTVRLIIHLFIFMCPKRITSRLGLWSDKLMNLRERLHIHEVTAKESFVKRNNFTTGGILLQLITIFICLLTFWSVTLLLVEVISFSVEVFIYTFMGVIVNAGVTLQYCTVFFLLFFYGKNTFSSVHQIYQAYHGLIHDEILAMKKGEIDAVARLDASEQQNTAFRVVGEMTSQSPRLANPVLKVKNNIPQWLSSGMLVFLDRYDTPYTPEKFFCSTINLDYFGCPGKIYINFVKAVWDFSKIVLFLLFIFIIVMAFGDAYRISSTNQLLATVVGGIVPFFVRNFFKSNTCVAGFDTTSVQFKTEFHTAINTFEQAWPVYDIIPVGFKEVGSGFTDLKILHGPQSTDSSLLTTINTNTNTHNGITNEIAHENNEPSACTEGFKLKDETVRLTGLKKFSSDPLLRTPSSYMYDSFDEEDNVEIDIIVDVSTKRNNSVLKKNGLSQGQESGSMSMLDWNKGKSRKMKLASRTPTNRLEDVV